MSSFDPNIDQHISGQCPPLSSTPAEGEYYRHVLNLPCKDSDMMSDIKLNKKPLRPLDNCDSWGCSLCDSVDAVIALRERVPFFRKKGVFAKVIMKNEYGVIDNNVGHRTFWKYIGSNMPDFYEACDV